MAGKMQLRAWLCFRAKFLRSFMRKAASPSRSSSGQLLWAMFILLVALWIVAFAVHLGGGFITYMLLISLAILTIRSASRRRRRAPVEEAAINQERAA